jgi:uncharacterized protein YjiK
MIKIKYICLLIIISINCSFAGSPAPLNDYSVDGDFSQLTTEFNLSGITYNPIADEYVTVNQDRYCRLDSNFNQVFCGVLSCGDCEDIVYLGVNGQFYEYAIVEEGGSEGSIYIVQSPMSTHSIRIDLPGLQTLTYAATSGGDSGEGIAFDALNNKFYVCIEDPLMQVLEFDRPNNSNDATYANGSLNVTTTLNSTTLENILGVSSDLSSCYYNPASNRLWLMSDIAHNISDIDLQGNLHQQLTLPDQQVEGFTFNQDFSQLVIVAEPNNYQTYSAQSTGDDLIFANDFEDVFFTELTKLSLEDKVNVTRNNWPISGGVGFTKGMVSNIQQLGLLETPSQARVLSRWSDGSIRFALFDFIIETIPANTKVEVTVIKWPENQLAISGNSVTEDNDFIELDNQTIKLKISKNNFSYLGELSFDANNNGIYENDELLFESGMQYYDNQSNPPIRSSFSYLARSLSYDWNTQSYVVDQSHPIASANPSTLNSGPAWIRQEGGGTETRVNANDNYNAQVVENGPLKTVIKLTGSFAGESEYSIWLYVYNKQPSIRVQHNFEVHGDPQLLNIRRLALSLPIDMGNNPNFIASGMPSNIVLNNTQKGHHWREGPANVSNLYHKGFPLPWQSGIAESNPSRGIEATAGWMEISNENIAITLSMRDMAYKYPKELSFDVSNQTLNAWIWPDYGDKVLDISTSVDSTGMEGVSFTHDINYHFHTPGSLDNDQWATAMDDPPQPTAPPEWYAYYGTQAAGMIMPFEPERFPITEAFMATRGTVMMRSQIEYGMLGMLNFGDMYWGYRAWQLNGNWDGQSLGTWGFHQRQDDYDGWRRGNSMLSTRMFMQYLRTGQTSFWRHAEAHLKHVRDALVKHHNSIRADGIGIGRRHSGYFGAVTSDRQGGVANEGYGSNWLGHYLHWNLTGDWQTLDSLQDIRSAWINNPWDTSQVRKSAFVGLKMTGTIPGFENDWDLAEQDNRPNNAGVFSSDSTQHWRDCAWFFGYPLYLSDVGSGDNGQGANLIAKLQSISDSPAPDGNLNWQRDVLAAVYWAAEDNPTIQSDVYNRLMASGSTETFYGSHTNASEIQSMQAYFDAYGLNGLWNLDFEETLQGQNSPFAPSVLTIDWRAKDDLLQIQWDEPLSMAVIHDWECKNGISNNNCPN